VNALEAYNSAIMANLIIDWFRERILRRQVTVDTSVEAELHQKRTRQAIAQNLCAQAMRILGDALNFTDEDEYWLHQPILTAMGTLADVVAQQDKTDDKLFTLLRNMSFTIGGIGDDLTFSDYLNKYRGREP